MSFIDSSLSALGRLAAVAVFAGAFLFGLAGVVYLSLQGDEIQMPEITGKNLSQSEEELAALGLKIKKRADRFSPESPNTVIEQLPKPGETVKSGQTIIVVTSKGPGEGDLPATLKTSEEDEADKIEEMISDKPKKAKPTTRKKADTARDVTGNTAGDTTGSTSGESNSNKKEGGDDGKPPADKTKKDPPPGGGRMPNPPSGGDSKPKPKP